jgi:hypothetical protein
MPSRKRDWKPPRRRVVTPAKAGDVLIAGRTGPGELDQMHVFMTEADVARKPTDLDGLREMASYLPFEPAMFQLAVLAVRLEPIVSNSERQWELAQQFYASQPLLLKKMARARARLPGWTHFSPQVLALLKRVLLDEVYRELDPDEFKLLQDAVPRRPHGLRRTDRQWQR